jgi:hypothetical protein
MAVTFKKSRSCSTTNGYLGGQKFISYCKIMIVVVYYRMKDILMIFHNQSEAFF